MPNSVASLISVTPDAEKIMAFVARVSNPANQDNPDYSKLLAFCIKNNHWSVFEMASMTIEVSTNLAIATQILRHRSFTFQQFSGRYADMKALSPTIPVFELREQDTKNRQNSTETISHETQLYFAQKIEAHFAATMSLYTEMLDAGIAKECARLVMPQATPTKMYITGSVRSWIHYISLRELPHTQKEHRTVTLACKEIFKQEFPTVSAALGWA